MWERNRKFCKKEDGNAMVSSVFIMVILILTTGMAVDFGLYVVKYEEVRSIAQTSIDEVSSMSAFYASIPNPSGTFSSAVSEYAAAKGDGTISVSSSLSRSFSGASGSEEAVLTAWVKAESSYQTIFMQIGGIETLPVRVSKKATHTFFVGKQWASGMPEEEWVRP